MTERNSAAPVAVEGGSEPLLEFQGVSLWYPAARMRLYPRSKDDSQRILKDVSFRVSPSQSLAIVGESGSGKSTICRLAMGLIAASQGKILLNGEDVTRTHRWKRRDLLGLIQIVFQNPMDALNPRYPIIQSVAEPLICLDQAPKKIARERAAEMLLRVGIGTVMHSRFPHQLSGGQAQRVNIARALVSNPKLLICDEPTSALDVSVQAQILNLLKSMTRELGISLLFVSHDLRCVSFLCESLIVLENGVVVEHGPTNATLAQPKADYTRSLVQAVSGVTFGTHRADTRDVAPPTRAPATSAAVG